MKQSDPAGSAIARICVIASLLVAGCTGTRPVELGRDHPANPHAEQPRPPRLREILGPDAQTERTHALIKRRAATMDGAIAAPGDASSEPTADPHRGHEHAPAHEH